MPESVASRVAVNTDNIADLQTEVGRLRERIHHLESAIHGVRVLTKVVDELQDSLPTLARRAARDAVTEYNRRQHADRFANWRMYLAVLTFGVALGAFIVSLVHG
jgi:hypothetical protein